MMKQLPENPIERALYFAKQFGMTDGAHHKNWVIDQMTRALLNCPLEFHFAKDSNDKLYQYEDQGQSKEYLEWIKNFENGKYGPKTYEWDIGFAP